MGTRGRVAVALELVVEIGVRVDVEDRESGLSPTDGPEHRVGHGVVAAERDGPGSLGEQRGNPGLDPRARVAGRRQDQVAGVRQARGAEHVAILLAPGIPGR